MAAKKVAKKAAKDAFADAPKKAVKEAPRVTAASVTAEVLKAHGAGSVRKASEVPTFNHIDTGVFVLDFALLGGFAEGLASSIYGHESTGKTTLCLRTVASKLRKYPKMTAVWMDMEKTFDPVWAMKHGVDMDRLLVAEPDTGEDCVDEIQAFMEAEDVCVVVMDSVPACVPFDLADKSASDATMTLLARLMGRLCSKILQAWTKERKKGHFVDVMLVNQWRSKVGFVLGNPNMLPGGKQLNFLTTTKLELKNRKKDVGQDEFGNDAVMVNQHAFSLEKTKIGRSIPSGEFDVIADPFHPLGETTVNDHAVALTFAKRMGFVTGGGSSWRICNVDQTFGKLDDMVAFMVQTPDEYTRLKRLLIARQRVVAGLDKVPADGYLLGHVSRRDRSLLTWEGDK